VEDRGERVNKSTAIAILAAGSSRRLGTPKQLLQFEGESLLRRAVHTAVSAGVPTVVIIGAFASLMEEEIQGQPVTVVKNGDWEEGIASSVRCAVLHLPADADAILLMTVDQPRVTAHLLKKIIRAYQTNGFSLVACRYGGTVGIPALYDRSLFPELLALRGDIGAKPVIETHLDRVFLIDAQECCFDIDARGDWLSDPGPLVVP
jgi:molybdenum cofactor cytidylyltransferase